MSEGLKTIKVKLVPSEDFKYLNNMVDIAGIIYNTAITIENEYYEETGLYLGKYALQKTLKALGEVEDNNFWHLLNSQTIQDVTDRIDRAFKLFFSNLKDGIKCSPPKRRNVKKAKSFTCKQCGYKILPNSRIRIGKKVFKYYDSYDGLLERSKIRTLTVKRTKLGEIFIYATTLVDITMGKSRDDRKAVGMDFGLKTFLTLSDESVIRSPEFFKNSLSSIRRANRNLSRKKQNSGNKKRAILELERRHIDIVNRRRDFFWKTARVLCKKYCVICIETLNMKTMQKRWGRKVSDLAYSEFVQILKFASKKFGTEIVEIGKFYPSTKKCSVCGHVKETIALKERVYKCDVCGYVEDRDVNAAHNILNEGLSELNKMKIRAS